MDFCETFDTVAHNRLLNKLKIIISREKFMTCYPPGCSSGWLPSNHIYRILCTTRDSPWPYI